MSTLPPCSASLRKHTARAHYIAKLWRLAAVPMQHLDHFENNGWLPDGNIDWIDDAYPSNVESLFNAQDDSPRDEDDDLREDMPEDDGDLTDDEDEEV